MQVAGRFAAIMQHRCQLLVCPTRVGGPLNTVMRIPVIASLIYCADAPRSREKRAGISCFASCLCSVAGHFEASRIGPRNLVTVRILGQGVATACSVIHIISGHSDGWPAAAEMTWREPRGSQPEQI